VPRGADPKSDGAPKQVPQKRAGILGETPTAAWPQEVEEPAPESDQALSVPDSTIPPVSALSTCATPFVERSGEEVSEGRRERETRLADASHQIDVGLENKETERPQERKRINPDKRGGRPHGPGRPREDNSASPRGDRSQRAPKPEVVCWKKAREWILAVEVSRELGDGAPISVSQNGTPLVQDQSQDGRWRLAELGKEIMVTGVESKSGGPLKIGLARDSLLFFKLSGDHDRGRRVSRPCFGSYLVVAPQRWERIGTPPFEPEDVCLPECRAHFFELEGDQAATIAFRDAEGGLRQTAPGGPRFDLIGQQLTDANESMGPLFGGELPCLRTASGWKDVETIVVGEEGEGSLRWRFGPSLDLSEQGLPAGIAELRVGHYFTRFYDMQEELIDSLDFRFVAGLRGITIQPDSPLPRADGHEPRAIGLRLDGGYGLAPLSADSREVEIVRDGCVTLLTIPPKPDCDRTGWLVRAESGRKVQIELLVERVWWALSDENKEPSQWCDVCLALAVGDFKPTSNKAIWLRVPKPRWSGAAFVGFRPEAKRRYSAKVSERTIVIPLRDLGDAQELEERGKERLLRVWVDIGGPLLEAALGAIAAAPHVDACRLACALTALRRITSGPLRTLLKEVRQQYRRPRGSAAHSNDEFAKEALSAITVFLQVHESQPSSLPRRARRWLSQAALIRQNSPEVLAEIRNRYRELERRYNHR
jgi:hypothetical protein